MIFSKPLVSPIYNSSVYAFADLDCYEKSLLAKGEEFVYARDGHPNLQELTNNLNHLENTQAGIVTGSGMGAICASIFATCQSGDRIIAGKRLYGRTIKVFTKDLANMGIIVDLVDETNLADVKDAFRKPAKVMFLESITNPTCRIPDFHKILEMTHNNKAFLIIDNTFATPGLFRPCELGADLVIESLTKVLCGHSDVTLGYIGGNKILMEKVQRIVFDFGFFPSPNDCWLLCRSLETFALRMRESFTNALHFAKWIKNSFPTIRIDFPGLNSHPDHSLAKSLLGDLFGNIMAIEIPGGREGVNKFLRAVPEIPFSPSLGHSHTTCSHSWSTSHRQLSNNEKHSLGITEGLLRFSIGFENLEELKTKFAKGIQVTLG